MTDHPAASLLSAYPQIAAAWLFGSEARGDARPDSDVDMAILLRDPTDAPIDHWEALLTLASDLESVWPGRPIDVVVLGSHGPIFTHAVLREGSLVYDADPDRRVDFEADTYVRYFDFRPVYDLATEGRRTAIRRRLEQRRAG